jgi:Lysine methyltransferase
MFVSEDYVVKKFTFGDLSQDLLCSNMSCTSHDLTGQIVWPAAILLSHFVYTFRENLHGGAVLELGAGCGLAGFVAANYWYIHLA